MKGVQQGRQETGTITLAAIVRMFVSLMLKRPQRAVNPAFFAKMIRRTRADIAAFPKWRKPFSKLFHENELEYLERLAPFETHEVDLNGDFVYFPLQLQPEMTTASLGGKFRDQAYAIERISKILPPNVRILVKENPKQGAYMRGQMFFRRLARIPYVTIVPTWTDTHALTDRSEFVAAITGTVGWEAIRQGKPALVFGNAWFQTLPGVHEYSDAIT